jgi:hypothetical protein
MMKSIAALLLCLLSSLAGAQPVYRCGNAYSQSPCPAGGRIVDATDSRLTFRRSLNAFARNFLAAGGLG